MSITWKLALTYAWRHPARMILTSLAMIASACIVVWVVSGYDALMSQFGDQAAEYLGRYDLFLVPDVPEAFASPNMREAPKASDAVTIPPELIAAMETDPAVEELDRALQATVKVQPVPSGEMGFGDPPGMEGERRKQTYKHAAPASGSNRPTRLRFELVVPVSCFLPLAEERGMGGRGSGRGELGGSNAGGPAASSGRSIGRPGGSGASPGTGAGPRSEGRGPGSGRGGPSRVRRGMFPGSPKIVGTWAETAPYELADGRWIEQGEPALRETVVSNQLADQMELKLGNEVLVILGKKEYRLKIVGIVAQTATAPRIEKASPTGRPMMGQRGTTLGPAPSALYVPMPLAEKITKQPGRVSLVSIKLREGFSDSDFRKRWSAEVGGTQPPILLAGLDDITGAMEGGFMASRAKGQAWAATGISLLAALFIIFTTLSMGVSERVRQFAVLRAVGLTRFQVARIIGAESLLLALIGWGGGLAAGWGLLAVLTRAKPDLFTGGASLGAWCVILTGLSALGGALAAAVLPAWQATSVRPLDAMSPQRLTPPSMRGSLVAFQVGGLPAEEIDAVRRVEGVVAEECIPLAVEQPRLADDITDSQRGSSVTRQDNVIMIGLDPRAAFGKNHPLLTPEFVEGSPEEALDKLQRVGDRYCIVPDHFLAATGLKLGDRFAVVPPESLDKTFEYTIAGAVSLPGWHWMTKFSGLRRRSGRSAAMVFASYDDVRRDFELKQTNFLWMNLKEDAAVEHIGEAMQPIADRNLGEAQPVNAQGTWEFGAAMFGQSLRITTPDGVRARILGRADGMIWAMCQLPLITLLVSSLAVVNTIMASVRARRWELGVLRALGVTRWTLTRMILAEGLLIGLVACLLSLAFGLMAGWCGTGISQYVSFFGGLHPALVVPWLKLFVGFGVTMLLCVAAAVWPAFSAGRAEPLALLQAGRAAM